MQQDNVDITPTPKILRTLGDIPFQPWQCLAELIDNSIDAFAEAKRAGNTLPERRITVAWSGPDVAASSRTIEIQDTGTGMTIGQLQNAARAGYSSNDPINNLGLFGMGFNIATARLGEKTKLLSATSESESWIGIEIDFAALIGAKNFSAPMIVEPKKFPGETGTRIVVSRLKEGTYAALRDNEAAIRRQLEIIYTPMLDQVDVDIFIHGKRLSPRRHCIWSKSRYVSREGKNIPAVIEIDRELGSAFFDLERNSYLNRDDEANLREQIAAGGELPPYVIERHKRLTGWIGIQRYSDPNDFGIDFVRNGRKILIGNKWLFSYENPMTGTSTLEYPVELGSTVGGRIVGEVHVDYLLPTYQKNDFDRTDPTWQQTVEALRGVGPLLPQKRKAMGFLDANTSPIGLLANAYRRLDAGIRSLFVDRTLAKAMAERFRKGDVEYLTDDKWWEAAQEADKLRATGGAGVSPEVDAGNTPSDNASEYGPVSDNGQFAIPVLPLPPSQSLTPVPSSKLDNLITASSQIASWSGSYTYGQAPPLNIKIWSLNSGQIFLKGETVPCLFNADGIDCDFIFNPRHPFLAQFPVGPRELMGLYLAEKFKARDNLTDIGKVYAEILQPKLQDVRIDRAGLQEKAAAMFDRLRELMILRLNDRAADVLMCIQESSGDTEETVNAMLSNSKLVMLFQDRDPAGLDALQHVPHRTLLRIVDRFPMELFDGHVFAAFYSKINLADPKATQRTRNESKERILTFLKDALWVLSPSSSSLAGGRAKDELARCSHSINFLSQEFSD